MMSPIAPCPSCAAHELKAHVETIASVPGFSADDELYQKRLAICTDCTALQGGIFCSYSAQYVFYRAKVFSAVCPFPKYDKWGDV